MPLPTRSTESRSKLPLLLALVAMLVGLLLWDRLSSDSPPEPGAAMLVPITRDRVLEGPDRRAVIEPLSKLALGDLHDTVDRPLFERGRRPVKPPVIQPVKAPPPPPPPRGPDPNALELVGILAGDQKAIVLLKRRQSGQQVRVQQGDIVDGWTVDRIEPQRVILKHGTTEVALQLFKKSNK